LLFAVYLFTGLGSSLVSLHQLAFDHDQQPDRFRRRLMGGGMDLRPLWQLTARLHAVDRRLSLQLHRFPGVAPPPRRRAVGE